MENLTLTDLFTGGGLFAMAVVAYKVSDLRKTVPLVLEKMERVLVVLENHSTRLSHVERDVDEIRTR